MVINILEDSFKAGRRLGIADEVSRFLVLVSESSFINPFAIIRAYPVVVCPEHTFPGRNDTLWAISIDGKLPLAVFNISEGCHGVGVSVHVIVFFCRKVSFIVFMMEPFPFHR